MAGEIDKWQRHGTMLGRNYHPAWSYLDTAREYLEAGRTLHLHPMRKDDVRWLIDDVPEHWKCYELQFPLMYCLAHASELLLKAFLSAHGKGNETPGWRNHAIGVLCQSCLSLGLVITANTRTFIDDLTSENDDFTYRFGERMTTPIFFPPTKSALQAVDELDKSVFPTIEPFIGTKGGGLL